MNKNLKKLLLAGILLYAIGMGIGFANLKNSQSQTPTTTFRLVEIAVKVTAPNEYVEFFEDGSFNVDGVGFCATGWMCDNR